MKRIFRCSGALLMSLILIFTVVSASGCGNPEANPEQTEPVKVVFSVGASGTTAASCGRSIVTWLKDCYADNDNVSFKVTSNKNQVLNMRKLNSGEVYFAVVPGDIVYFAQKGNTLFDAPLTDFSICAQCFTTDCQLVVKEGSDIQSLSDLAGKKVYAGAEGSSPYLNLKRILYAARIASPEYQTMDYSDAADALASGEIDAMFIVGDAPVKELLSTAVTDGIRLLPFDKELVDTLCQYFDYYEAVTIPAGCYENQTEAVDTIGIRTYLLSSKVSVSDELRKEILDYIMQGLNVIAEDNVTISEFKLMDI